MMNFFRGASAPPPTSSSSGSVPSAPAPPLNSAVHQAQEHQECPICFDDMTAGQVSMLCDRQMRPVCRHEFHTACVRELARKKCPLCREDFHNLKEVPHLSEQNAEAWFRTLDSNNDGSLSYDEVIDGLKSQLRLDWQRVEADVDRLWRQWDRNGDGSISREEFLRRETGVLAYLQAHYSVQPRPPPPDIRRDKAAWFQYWDEDQSGSLDKDEMSRALIKTFRMFHIDRHAVVATLEAIWPIFDCDNSGVIEMGEFIAADNLADTIIAQLQFHK